jgi:hypothetical protein
MTRECPKKKTILPTVAAAAIEIEDAKENSKSGNAAA